jgi:hypothetical protein
MDSGFSLAPSFISTSPMTFTHFMGMNPSSFYNDIQNYDTRSMPWVSNHFPIYMPNIPSPFPSSPLPSYMNPSFGSGGMMTPLTATSSFDKNNFPQPTLTVGGCNLPSYKSNPSHDFLGASAQMGGYSTYYTPSVYPSSTTPVPMNIFPMESPHMSYGISYRGNQFYGTCYPLHGTP